MSYILDAIKKSEAERNQGFSPGALAAVHDAPRTGTTRQLNNVDLPVLGFPRRAIGGWWMWQQTRATWVAPAADVPTPAVADVARPAEATLPESEAPAVEPTLPTTTPARVADTVEPAPAAAPTVIRPPPRAPAFSTHVYADDRDLRAVTLDGRRLTEGDLIEPGMHLVEITETGVIVDYHGERIAFDVLPYRGP